MTGSVMITFDVCAGAERTLVACYDPHSQSWLLIQPRPYVVQFVMGIAVQAVQSLSSVDSDKEYLGRWKRDQALLCNGRWVRKDRHGEMDLDYDLKKGMS